MKIQKHTFIFCLIPLFTIILLNSCSEEDAPQTFLEMYDGTKWFSDNDNLYIRISDNTSVIFEQWINNVYRDCYHYNTLGDVDSVEIIENSKDKFVHRLTNDENQTVTFTATVEGDILKFIVTEVDGFYAVLLTKTLINVDDLQICSIEPHSFNQKEFLEALPRGNR